MKNGEVVRVVMVPKQHAKCIKTSLEQHQLLNRNFRISNVVNTKTDNDTNNGNDGNGTNDTDTTTAAMKSSLVAIPVWDSMTTSTTTTERDVDGTNQCKIHDTDDTENRIETMVSRIIHNATTPEPIDTNMDIPQQPDQISFHFGYQFCQYSSRILGNNSHHLQTNPNQSLAGGNNNRHHNITVVQSILIQAISKFLSQNHIQHHTDNIRIGDYTATDHKATTGCTNTNRIAMITMDEYSEQEQLFHDVVIRLSTDTCPLKLELLGDDRTIVLPRKALQYYFPSDVHPNTVKTSEDTRHTIRHDNDDDDDQDKSNHRKMLSFSELLNRYGISTNEMVETFLKDYLWCDMAQTFHSHRIVRRDEIHPHSPTRQSNYQIVWYDPSYYSSEDTYIENDESTNTSIDLDATTIQKQSHRLSPCSWITVTEQGIRQSFDMTKVMFSRGNITEKIRYGTQLVQKDELILDMYAGIGYFTLPALIHGHAQHVYCCEWNPHAIAALKYNLQDNHVSDRATIFAGDCRVSIQSDSSALQHRFDRICLGLLPSSEGGWSSAILALRKDIGGWLHIHGNVPQKEVHHWSQWLSQSLKSFLLETTCSLDDSGRNYDAFCDWIVLVVHVEKVKSFAPNVNHYVADVFVGPCHCFPAKNGWPPSIPKECFQQCLLGNTDGGGGCLAGVVNPDKQCIELCTATEITPPSCALSPHGPLYQRWMSSY